MVEISDQKSFERWLKDKPAEWAQVLAMRSALRVLPFIAVDNSQKIGAIRQQILLLALFQVSTSSWVAQRYPTSRINNLLSNAISNAARVTRDSYPASALFSITAASRAARAYNVVDSVIRAACDSVTAAIRSIANGKNIDSEAIWRSVNTDRLILHDFEGLPVESANRLSQLSVWNTTENQVITPDWAIEAEIEFSIKLIGLDPNWHVWTEWYQSRLDGIESWGLKPKNAETLMLRIVKQESKWWEQSSVTVNAEIALWLARMRKEEEDDKQSPIFISYSTKNENTAKDVGQVMEGLDFPVFAQYKDMPPGSNFITEMQDGLDKMGRLVALYSPEYFDSDICQDEWNAAYNQDRGGRKRKIIGFKIAPCDLKPLQDQIVYTPLYGLSKNEARKAIHHALTWDGEKLSRSEGRKAAAASASPQPVNKDGELLSVSSNSVFDNPFLDCELPKLPELIRQRIAAVLKALEGKNAPSMVATSLQDYSTELAINGLSPYIPNLRGLIEIVEAEINDTLGNWYSGGVKVALEQIFAIHAQIIDRFPLDAKRERFIRESPLDPAVFDDVEFKSDFEKYLSDMLDLAREGLADEEFSRVAEVRQRRYRDIDSLRDISVTNDPAESFITKSDQVTPAEIKKRYLFQESGFADKLLDRGPKITAVADSETGKSILSLAKRLVEVIWGG